MAVAKGAARERGRGGGGGMGLATGSLSHPGQSDEEQEVPLRRQIGAHQDTLSFLEHRLGKRIQVSRPWAQKVEKKEKWAAGRGRIS